MTVVADDVGRHDTDRRRLLEGVQHPALRPSHPPPARLRGELPARGCQWGLGKRDLVSNINWYMNVPVERDGTLGIVDGLSSPGLSVSLRAEVDTLVLVSNCPQVNNPCNGFDPTPVRMVVTAP